MTTQPSRPTAVGAYVFAGGFTLGMREHLDILCHLESGPYGVATARLNLDVKVHDDPWPTGALRGRVDVVYANPPCAPWSSAGSKNKGPRRDYSQGYDPRDERVGCLKRVFSLLDLVRPSILATESVTRLWTAGRPLVDWMAREAAAMDYATTVVLLDAFDCGAPQRRRRAFVVFSRMEIAWQRPKPPPGSPRTVREALSGVDPGPDIPDMWPEEDVCLHYAQQGDKLRAVYDDIAVAQGWISPKGRPGFLRRRLAWDAPSPTHTGGDVLYHPQEHRKISAREAQVLCGYPAGYEFVGSTGQKFRQIAQAVMPPVGRWLGKILADACEKDVAATEIGTRVVDFVRGQG